MLDNNLSKTLLINKPINWTSFDIVKKIRGLIKKKYNIKKLKVGHSGTLDPLASGLLIICTGHNTKKISQFTNLKKKYIGILKLGCTTDSFDAETPEKNIKKYKTISIEDVYNTFTTFTGHQKQSPPVFSALKVGGERLYKKARRGDIDIELKARNIIIHELKLLEFNLPFIKFEVCCSKGTYIRSLAHDIGQDLSCGAYLYNLIRIEIGNYKLEKALDINNIGSSL